MQRFRKHFGNAARIVHSLSIDAAIVGLVWQALFSLGFERRLPDIWMNLAILMTVWLVYVADRLLDATRLDLSLPTTSRHRFHYRYRKPLTVAWIVILVVDAVIIATAIDDSVRRPGFFVAVAVLAYAAGIHLAGFRMKIVPKECQVGLLFALGISLVAWPAHDLIAVAKFASAVLMAAVLFTVNCLVVSIHETSSDRAQSFASWSTQHRHAGKWAASLAVILGVVALVTLVTAWVPMVLAASVAVGSSAMLALLFKTGLQDHSTGMRAKKASLSDSWPLGLTADLGLAVPALCLCVFLGHDLFG